MFRPLFSRPASRLHSEPTLTGVLGGGVFGVNNPASGTYYDQAADGTWTLNLTQPGSTLPLTRVELRYRYADDNNYWTVYLERDQTNAQWNMRRAKVVSGTRTETSLQTNIGSVAAIRVTVSGTSHEWFSSSDGSSFTSRGTATDAALQTNTKVGAHYNGGTGSQLITNGDFDNWTGDNPDNWTVFSETTGRTVSQSGADAQFTSDAAFAPQAWAPVPNSTDLLFMTKVTVTSGRYALDNNTAVIFSTTVSGTFASRGTTTNTNVRAMPYAAPADFLVEYIYAYLLGSLDDGGATGPTRLY